MSTAGDTGWGSRPYSEWRVVAAVTRSSLVQAEPVHSGHANRATRLRPFGNVVNKLLVVSLVLT